MALSEEFKQIGYDIIGAAFDVRNNTGRGLREVYYRKALAWELQQKGYEVKQEFTVPALYRGNVIGDAFKADILVDNRVIIEVKAIGKMDDEESRQIITYLKLSDFKLGYLINFGSKEFRTGKISDPMPYDKGIYRIVNGIE